LFAPLKHGQVCAQTPIGNSRAEGKLQFQVQGFVGRKLRYDKAFTVDRSNPLFVRFNYSGVNEVKFVPLAPDIFVMDNVSIGQAPETNAGTLLLVGGILACAHARIKKMRT